MMENKSFVVRTIISSLLVSFFILVGIFAASKLGLNWGKIEFLPASTITVTGEAKSDQKSGTASYSVSVSASNNDKDTAINEVNTKMTDIIAKVKAYGIAEEDIKTQQVSTYETKDTVVCMAVDICPPVPLRWQASNSLEMKLKDASKASEFTDILNKTGATSVYGPNFGLTDVNASSDELLADAIKDARKKAEKIASAAGRKLGKVITVSESGSPVYYPMALDVAKERSATPIEPGTQTVYKSVSVVFELK